MQPFFALGTRSARNTLFAGSADDEAAVAALATPPASPRCVRVRAVVVVWLDLTEPLPAARAPRPAAFR